MALRREDLTDEQAERQRALDLSWSEAMRDLADPEFRAYLDASLKRLNEAPSRDTLSGDEFLALMRSQTQ